jgi:hypothetical protein
MKIPPPFNRLMPSLMVEGDIADPNATLTCNLGDLTALLSISLTPAEIDEAMAPGSLVRRAPSGVIEGSLSDTSTRFTCALRDFRALLETGLASIAVDEKWYLRQYPDVQQAVSRTPADSATAHYLVCGFIEGRLPSEPAVDEEFYRSSYPDVADAIHRGEIPDATAHYLRSGYREGRLPSAPEAGSVRIPAANTDNLAKTTDPACPASAKDRPAAADHPHQRIPRGRRGRAPKKIAVITDVMGTAGFFPRWLKYYGDQFGNENLYLVTYINSTGNFSEYGVGGIWRTPENYNEDIRRDVITSLVSTLLKCYNVVVRVDIDEFIAPDLRRYLDLAEYVNALEQPYVTAMGLEIFEDSSEFRLSDANPILVKQRKFAYRVSALNKTCITSVPILWSSGFHAQTVPPVFHGLYLFHTKLADLSPEFRRHRMILANSDGTKETEYFSDSDRKLSAAREAASKKTKLSGWENFECDASIKKYLASVHVSAAGYYGGDFFQDADALVIPAEFAGIF